MKKSCCRPDFWFLIRLIALGVIAVFMVYPFSSLVYQSFFGGKTGAFTLDNYKTFFTLPYYYKTLLNSLNVSFTATCTALVIGLPMAYLMTRYNIAGKKLWHILAIMSLMSPPFIGAYSWILLFGRNGVATRFLEAMGLTVGSIYGRTGIVVIFTLMLYPYIYLYVSGAMSSIDKSLEEAAENLGSSKWRRIMTITLPVVMPSIASGAIVVFLTALADFGTPMLIGEGYKVLPVMIYDEYMSEIGANDNLASALSVVIVICSSLVLLLQKIVIARHNYVMTSMRPPEVVRLHGWKRFWATLPVAIIVCISILPQLVVLITSFIKTNGPVFLKGVSLGSYRNIVSRLSGPISNTFLFSFAAILCIVVLGMLIAYLIVRKKGKIGTLLDFLVMFPYVIPGSVLGISLIMAFNHKPCILTGTAAIIIISFVIRKMPFTVRSSSAFLQQMDPSVEEASINLGVSPMKTFFKITARMMAPGVLSGAILSWITCINELSSSIMLYTGRTTTISVSIYTEVVRNSYGTAAALASILTITTALSLFVFMRISKGKVSVV
ncbi:MAG: iron ABC transporter permease [Sphaerochaetaceae bacterium]